MNKENKLVVENMKKLELYVPVVERVHGPSHPEFYQVRKIFDEIASKIDKNDGGNIDLLEEFKGLREVTSNYRVPADVCESYEAVYKMLSELDEEYSK